MKQDHILIHQAFNKYIWASILTVAASRVANVIDASLVGNIIGPDGLAAVTASAPVLQAVYAISTLFIASLTIMTGMALGKGDNDRAAHLFSFATCISIIIGIILPLMGMAFFPQLSALLCMSDTLRPMADAYLWVTILSATPQLLLYCLQQFVTVDGSPRLVTRAIIIGNIVNIALDILFMRYLNMGIAGAAWATYAMYVVSALLLIPHFRNSTALHFRRSSRFRNHIQLLTLPSSDLRHMFTLGLPLFLSTCLVSVQITCFNNTAATHLGTHGLVIMAICMQLYAFSMIILTGTLRTIQPIGSKLHGTGDNRGMLVLLRRAYSFLAISLTIYGAILWLFPHHLAAVLGVTDATAIECARQALPPFALFIVMQALLYNLMPVYQFYGHHRLALLLSISQTLIPIATFWFTAPTTYPWWGFFIGQLTTALIIIISAHITHRHHPDTIPLILITRS